MNERYGYGTVTHESPGLDYAGRLNSCNLQKTLNGVIEFGTK